MDARRLQLTTVLRALRGRTVPPAPDGVDGAGSLGAPAQEVPEAVLALAAALDTRRRAQVLRPLDPAHGTGTDEGTPAGGQPLRWGSAAARQIDSTTCGAAVLAMLAAAGDPALAAWLVTGTVVPGTLPPELRGLDADDLPEPGGPAVSGARHPEATWSEATAARWGALQRAVHRAASHAGGAASVPWPRAFGTTPWGAAHVARFPDVAYRSVMVDDTRADELRDLLVRVDRALDRGVPVPLYSGGDLHGGPAAAVPRHVVLATRRTGGTYRVYEPASGRLLPIERTALEAPGGPHPALGGWTHLCWALLPVRRTAA